VSRSHFAIASSATSCTCIEYQTTMFDSPDWPHVECGKHGLHVWFFTRPIRIHANIHVLECTIDFGLFGNVGERPKAVRPVGSRPLAFLLGFTSFPCEHNLLPVTQLYCKAPHNFQSFWQSYPPSKLLDSNAQYKLMLDCSRRRSTNVQAVVSCKCCQHEVE